MSVTIAEPPKDNMPNPDEIIEVCREARPVPANAANCNEFVTAVRLNAGLR